MNPSKIMTCQSEVSGCQCPRVTGDIEELGCLFMFGKKCLAITPILGLLFTSLVTPRHRQASQDNYFKISFPCP